MNETKWRAEVEPCKAHGAPRVYAEDGTLVAVTYPVPTKWRGQTISPSLPDKMVGGHNLSEINPYWLAQDRAIRIAKLPMLEQAARIMEETIEGMGMDLVRLQTELIAAENEMGKLRLELANARSMRNRLGEALDTVVDDNGVHRQDVLDLLFEWGGAVEAE